MKSIDSAIATAKTARGFSTITKAPACEFPELLADLELAILDNERPTLVPSAEEYEIYKELARKGAE